MADVHDSTCPDAHDTPVDADLDDVVLDHPLDLDFDDLGDLADRGDRADGDAEGPR